MEIVYVKEKLKKCPFCKGDAAVVKDPLWNGSHGYHGCHDYYVKCMNEKCKVKPHTRKWDDIYRSAEDAINKAIDGWNDREEK